jgi:hypothetical protein
MSTPQREFSALPLGPADRITPAPDDAWNNPHIPDWHCTYHGEMGDGAFSCKSCETDPAFLRTL